MLTTSPERPSKYDVFISYHHSDEKESKKLESLLKRDLIGGKSLSVFIAPYTISPGDNFVLVLEEALGKARFVLLILSPEALKAEWPIAERAAAILSDPAGRLGRVIPVIVKACRLPPLLAFRQYVDLRDKAKYGSETTKLVCTLKGLPLPQALNKRLKLETKHSDSPLVAISSAVPDEVEERIYSNLFRVRSLPGKIWNAPSSFTSHRQIIEYLGRRNIPPFILKENTLYSFSEFTHPNHIFKDIIDKNQVDAEIVKHWFHDDDSRRWLIELLNDSIRSHCFRLSMTFDGIGRRFFFPLGVLKSDSIQWTPHVRKSHRGLILTHESGGQVALYRHRAVDLRFELVEDDVFLRIDPGWVFTEDGRRPIESRRRRAILTTRFLSRQRNLAGFTEMRFWAWLLSDDGRTIRFDLGGPSVEINTLSDSVNVRAGIFGDTNELPRLIESPPTLVDYEEEEYSLDDEVSEAIDEEVSREPG